MDATELQFFGGPFVMKSRLFPLCRTMFVLLTCLAVVMPAWAGARSIRYSHECYLMGVDCRGCLTYCGGSCETFCGTVNCRTGRLVGKASGCVENESCRNQCYRNCDLVNNLAVITSSVYKVSKRGAACYTACGYLEQHD
jgi:hypothetical protein